MVVGPLVIDVGTLAENVGGVVVEAKVCIVSVAVLSDRDVVDASVFNVIAEVVKSKVVDTSLDLVVSGIVVVGPLVVDVGTLAEDVGGGSWK